MRISLEQFPCKNIGRGNLLIYSEMLETLTLEPMFCSLHDLDYTGLFSWGTILQIFLAMLTLLITVRCCIASALRQGVLGCTQPASLRLDDAFYLWIYIFFIGFLEFIFVPVVWNEEEWGRQFQWSAPWS